MFFIKIQIKQQNQKINSQKKLKQNTINTNVKVSLQIISFYKKQFSIICKITILLILLLLELRFNAYK